MLPVVRVKEASTSSIVDVRVERWESRERDYALAQERERLKVESPEWLLWQAQCKVFRAGRNVPVEPSKPIITCAEELARINTVRKFSLRRPLKWLPTMPHSHTMTRRE
jgi:hypothetical protein